MIHARRLGLLPLVVVSALLTSVAWHAARGEGAAGPPKASGQAGCDRGQFKVLIDVGHTAEAPGAISARGVPEYRFNLGLANQIGRMLVRAGFTGTSVLVTAGSTGGGLASRVERANGLPADLFVSVHHDSVPEEFLETWTYAGAPRSFSDRFKGHSLFVSRENGDPDRSLVFARLLGEALRARGLRYTPHYSEAFMGWKQRELLDAEAGVYRYDQLRVLRETRMPAVLLEAGSIIHRGEELQVATRAHRSLVGAAVTRAVELFCSSSSR